MHNPKPLFLSVFLSIQCLTVIFSTESVKAAEPSVYDVDGNGRNDALTDGLLTIRYLFGFRGTVLTNGAIGNDATRTTPSEIESYLLNHSTVLDIDGDRKTEALTDGLLLLRYMFGFRGNSLISNAIGDNATRKTATDIVAYIGGNDSCPAFFINTPSSKRCTRFGLATYTFNGNITGTGTISVQPYTGANCSGFPSGQPITDALNYSLQNLAISTNCAATAKMTIVTSQYGSRSRNVIINHGIVSF